MDGGSCLCRLHRRRLGLRQPLRVPPCPRHQMRLPWLRALPLLRAEQGRRRTMHARSERASGRGGEPDARSDNLCQVQVPSRLG